MSKHPPPWVSHYIGRPFDPSSWHCWELCRQLAADHLGMNWPSFAWAEGDARAAEIHRQSSLWREIFNRDMFLNGAGGETLGDVAVIRQGRWCGHVGMVVADGLVIHVEGGMGTALIKMRSAEWRRRIEGVYRWIG